MHQEGSLSVASYLFRRFLLAMLVLAVALLILFCLVYAVPGDPATVALGPRATEAQKIAFRERMGLDDPIVVQAITYLGLLLRGDMGVDLLSQRPVADLVLAALPRTVLLAVVGLGWAVALGLPLGVVSACGPIR